MVVVVEGGVVVEAGVGAGAGGSGARVVGTAKEPTATRMTTREVFPLLEPLTVIENVRGANVELGEMVILLEVDLVVSGLGSARTVTPFGTPETPRYIEPVKPFDLVEVMVVVAIVPGATATSELVEPSLKGTTVTFLTAFLMVAARTSGEATTTSPDISMRAASAANSRTCGRAVWCEIRFMNFSKRKAEIAGMRNWAEQSVVTRAAENVPKV